MRTLGRWTAILGAMHEWSAVASSRARRRGVLLRLYRFFLERWQAVASLHRRYGPMALARVRRRQFASAWSALAAASRLGARLGRRRDRALAARGLGALRHRCRTTRNLSRRVMVVWPRSQLAMLGPTFSQGMRVRITRDGGSHGL